MSQSKQKHGSFFEKLIFAVVLQSTVRDSTVRQEISLSSKVKDNLFNSAKVSYKDKCSSKSFHMFSAKLWAKQSRATIEDK